MYNVKQEYTIGKLTIGRMGEAFDLVERVFMEFDAPDFTPEGINNFMSSLRGNGRFKEKLIAGKEVMYTAIDTRIDKVIGIVCIAHERKHIKLVFVDKSYHRQGVGKALINEAIRECETMGIKEISLNSSPYAKDFYLNIGFEVQQTEKQVDGMRFTPMIYKID